MGPPTSRRETPAPDTAVYALAMQRSDVTREDGTRVGLSLDVRDRPQPGLCVFSAGPRLHRTVPRDDLAARTNEAVSSYQDELARLAGVRAVHGPAVPDGAATAGPELVRRLHDLNTAQQPTWAWPLPGGEDQWWRTAREVTVGQDWPRS